MSFNKGFVDSFYTRIKNKVYDSIKNKLIMSIYEKTICNNLSVDIKYSVY